MSNLFKAMNLTTTNGASLAAAIGVRPSSGAASCDLPKTLRRCGGQLFTDVAAPGDGRTPGLARSVAARARGSLKRVLRCGALAACLALAALSQAQTLVNVDFGVGTASLKTGLAATGMGTNDHLNLTAITIRSSRRG